MLICMDPWLNSRIKFHCFSRCLYPCMNVIISYEFQHLPFALSPNMTNPPFFILIFAICDLSPVISISLSSTSKKIIKSLILVPIFYWVQRVSSYYFWYVVLFDTHTCLILTFILSRHTKAI